MNDCHLGDVMEMLRPYTDLTFKNILEHLNSIFVFRTKFPVVSADGRKEKGLTANLYNFGHVVGRAAPPPPKRG